MEGKANNRKLYVLLTVLYDLVTLLFAMYMGMAIITKSYDDYTYYTFYLSRYAIALLFLNITAYSVLGIYKVKFIDFGIDDIKKMAYASGIVLVCNFVFVLISDDWFPIFWPFIYTVISILFSLALRFFAKAIQSKNKKLDYDIEDYVNNEEINENIVKKDNEE